MVFEADTKHSIFSGTVLKVDEKREHGARARREDAGHAKSCMTTRTTQDILLDHRSANYLRHVPVLPTMHTLRFDRNRTEKNRTAPDQVNPFPAKMNCMAPKNTVGVARTGPRSAHQRYRSYREVLNRSCQNAKYDPHSIYFQSFRMDMFMSLSFFMTLATDISKSSCVT